MASIYTNRNYHFNHNKLSDNNPFNNAAYNTYLQKPNPISNQSPSKPINNQQIFQQPNNANNFAKSTLYSTSNKYLTNTNPSGGMNFQDRVIAYGQDAEENFFKRSLRKQPVSNAIQSSSYGIINNIPKPVSFHNNAYSNAYSQRRDHVADLLSYTTGKNYYNGYPNNGRLPGYANVNQGESKVNDIYNMDNNNYNIEGKPNFSATAPIPQNPLNLNERKTPSASRTPNQYGGGQMTGTPNNNNLGMEKTSSDIPEYYEKNGKAVIEYAYKEDPNSKFRNYMEDKGKAVDCFNGDSNSALFALFDGHGGGEVSKFLQDNIKDEFRSIIPSENLEDSIITLFDSMDQKIRNSNFFHVGSTGCVVYITREKGKRILYCANIGDTRCVLLNAYQAKRLSYDDRASDKNEYNRIINSGGIVFAGRVYGQLMLSRAFGDWELKPYGVINVPHITRIEIEDKDHYIVMASDGIWDVFSDEDVYNISLQCSNAENLCNKIINDALLKGTMDNISCFVIRLN